MRALLLYGFFVATLAVVLLNCHSPEKNPFRNAIPGNAQYVGMEKCRDCHFEIYASFTQTGMGLSWGLATKQKSAADFSPAKALVYDSVKDLYYKPYWVGDSLWITEFRLSGRDTVHQRAEKVTYIVGSGQHTNSHIMNINGYLHQAPITYYTQKGRWDLAPGFEHGMNTRFDRKIEMECITCHNGYPEAVEGSLNKYTQVKLGIDCERCHGPGSLHVAEKMRGKIVDTARETDYTIVNPIKLSTEQQNNLCQRCHLQGIAVLKEGHSFDEFLPSHRLSQTMDVFMPVYSGDEQHMIMASHVERMKLSRCFLQSGKMSCITCHNPHVSVKFTPASQYNAACTSCHANGNDCKEQLAVRNAKGDRCFECHMPKNSSIDIPHVAVTDHFIRKRPSLISNKQEIARFLGMRCYNNDDPDSRSIARAYLEFYERYEQKPLFLDSAVHYLDKAGVDVKSDADPDMLRVLFLKEDYAAIHKATEGMEAQTTNDAWTCYRIGEACLQVKDIKRSVQFLQRAVALKPLALDFQNKLGVALLEAEQPGEARNVFAFILQENPKHASATTNLGFMAMQEGQWALAAQYLQRAVMLNPDHLQTLINLAVVYHRQSADQLAKPLLWHAMQLDPANGQVNAMWNDLNRK